MDEIIGVTYPIPQWWMDRFFKDGKTVFIKPATVWKKIQVGMKFVFYQSRKDTGYIGDATIKTILFLDNPIEFYDIYPSKIYISKTELNDYLKSQERRRALDISRTKRQRSWMAFELENIKKFKRIRKPEKFVPISGKYLERK
jgi:hypothetical protein